jgi:HK97 family phage prohead protease
MDTPQVEVVRFLAQVPELRAEDDGETLGTLTGYFSAHNVWYEVNSLWEGTFLERTADGFAADTIAEDRDAMRVLFDHGFDSIGNKVLGPIDVLESRTKGPYYEVPLLDTSYNRDLLPGLKRGLYGASFRMRVTGEEWDDEPKPSRHNPKAIPERTITRAKVMEFGPVTFPANPKASASVRSMTDEYYERLRQRDTSAFEAAVRAAGRSIPDITGRPDARSEGGGDSGTQPGNGQRPLLSTSDLRHAHALSRYKQWSGRNA